MNGPKFQIHLYWSKILGIYRVIDERGRVNHGFTC